jgi:hypothetical protein
VHQGAQTRLLLFRLGKLRLVARKRRARLINRGLHRPWIDPEERLTGLYAFTLLEQHIGQHTIDLRAHGDAVLGFHGPDYVDDLRHRLLGNLHGAHRYRSAATALARTLAFRLGRLTRRRLGRFRAGLVLPPIVSAAGGNQADDHKQFPGKLHE